MNLDSKYNTLNLFSRIVDTQNSNYTVRSDSWAESTVPAIEVFHYVSTW